MYRVVAFAVLWAASAFARDFDPRRDGFAFANETVLAYGVDEAGRLHMGSRETPPQFAHRCIAMIRGAMQFWKFARFQPEASKLSPDEYRRRLKHLFRIPVWFNPRPVERRITFPGYPDLWSFSRAQQRLVQEEIGAWLPTYLRVGNWRMPCPMNRLFQHPIARSIERAIGKGEPQAVFLAKFPSMNHAVLAYAATRQPDGTTRFAVYDPNYPGESARLDYVPKTNLFDFERRFYWPGGRVRAFQIYLSPIH
jgi:hypothetical protein